MSEQQIELDNSNPFPGIGRAWFLILYIVLLVSLYYLPVVRDFYNWLIQAEAVLYFSAKNWGGLNIVLSSLVAALLVNLAFAIVTAPLFYFRMINIKLNSRWLLILLVPAIWILLLIRCLVYQSGYTKTGVLDETGKLNLKMLNIVLLSLVLLVTMWFIADYL